MAAISKEEVIKRLGKEAVEAAIKKAQEDFGEIKRITYCTGEYGYIGMNLNTVKYGKYERAIRTSNLPPHI